MRTLIILICLFSLHGFAQDCKQIKKEYDKFSGETTIETPFDAPVWFLKILTGTDTNFSVSFRTYDTYLSMGDGLTILLGNGKKIDLPKQKVKCDLSGTRYRYGANIIVTKEIQNLILENGITDFRLYMFDYSLTEKEKKKTADLFKCIIDYK